MSTSRKDSDSVGVDEKVAVLVEQRSPPDIVPLQDGELLEPGVRASAEKRLVRILDMRLMPTIIIIFIMNYIDVSIFPFM